MRALNLTLECGGRLGCGERFEFREGATVEEQREVFRKHRAKPDHMEEVFHHKNTERMFVGLAPMDMEEMLEEIRQK